MIMSAGPALLMVRVFGNHNAGPSPTVTANPFLPRAHRDSLPAPAVAVAFTGSRRVTGRRAAAISCGMIRMVRGRRAAGPGGPGDPVSLGAGDHVAAMLVGQGSGDGRVHGHCLLLSGGTGPGASRRSPSRLLTTAQPRQRSDYPFRAPPAEGVKLPQADSLPGMQVQARPERAIFSRFM